MRIVKEVLNVVYCKCKYMFYRKEFNVMNNVNKFHIFDASVDGVFKLDKSLWLVTKPSNVRGCTLDTGTLIFKPDVTDYSNVDDLLVLDTIPNDQTNLCFKGKVLESNNIYASYHELDDVTFNVTGLNYLNDKLPSYDDYVSKSNFKDAVNKISLNLDMLKVFAGKENFNKLCRNKSLFADTDAALHRSFAVIGNDECNVTTYLPVVNTSGLFLKNSLKHTDFVWLSLADIDSLNKSSKYGLMQIEGGKDALNNGIKLDNEFGATLSFIQDCGIGKLNTDSDYVASNTEFDNILSAIAKRRYYAEFDAKWVDRYTRFEREYVYGPDRFFGCLYQIVAYDDTLPSGVSAKPFNVVLSSDFFDEGVITGVSADGVDITDDVKEFVVNDVDRDLEYLYKGTAVLKDGSLKFNADIDFYTALGGYDAFSSELTQLVAVGRYVENHGYNVDFNKVAYNFGIKPSVISLPATRLEQFHKGEHVQQPIDIPYFYKDGLYARESQSEVDILPSISDAKNVDNGIDR